MNEFRKEGKLVDVSVICGPQNFQAHRLILASCSPFFRELLIDDSIRNASSTLDLEDVKADLMDILLEFMYTGKAKVHPLDTQRILQLMTTAHLLQISSAAAYFCESLLRDRPNHNLTALWDWADEYKSLETENTIMNYILTNFNAVNKLRDFGNLPMDRLISILTQPTLSNPKHQDMVMQAILVWIKHNIDTRKENLHVLLPFVSIQHLSGSLKQYIGNDPLFKDVPEIGKTNEVDFYMTAAIVKEMTPMKMKVKCKTISRIKKPKNHEMSKKDVETKVEEPEIFTLDENLEEKVDNPIKELTISDTKTNKSLFSEAESGSIVLVAGRDDGNRFIWQCYIPSKDIWTTAKELNIPVKDKEGFAFYKNKLYIIGGESTHNSKLRDVFVYDMKTQTVKQGSSLWVARASPTVVQAEHLIFTIGGISRFEKAMTHVECLNIKSSVWKILPPIKEKRYSPGTAVINNNIYLIGGHTTRCEYYNVTDDTWYSMTSLPNYFQDTEVVSFSSEGNLYTLRCFQPEKVCCFDQSSNSWQLLKVNKQPPENILCVAPGFRNVWCLDKNCKLYYFDVSSLSWKSHVSLPHRLNKPQHLAVIKLEKKGSEN